jgi:hypothetical protein
MKLSITELDRKPSSCPYLIHWNGERFEFITDFMGGGEMGYLEERTGSERLATTNPTLKNTFASAATNSKPKTDVTNCA